MSKIITCPSGLSGYIDKLTGKNFELLGDRQLQRSGLFTDRLMQACWQSTADPGPYTTGEDGSLDWKNVLCGDRVYASIQIRILMYGDTFSFPAQCGDQRCRKPFPYWHTDLVNDLTVKKLSPEDLESFKNGNRFEAHFPDGRQFHFKLLTGADEVKIAKFGTQAKAFIPSLVSRIHDIDGVPEGGLRKFFESEGAEMQFDALRAMDEHDCGVDTATFIECPECGWSREVQIPFGEGGFFVPNRAVQKKNPTT